MISEGYASVTSRRVAKELDIKPSLVHYYFPTTDDLLLAVWLRSIETQRFHEEAEAINPLTLTKLRNRKTNCLSTGSIPISAITIK